MEIMTSTPNYAKGPISLKNKSILISARHGLSANLFNLFTVSKNVN